MRPVAPATPPKELASVVTSMMSAIAATNPIIMRGLVLPKLWIIMTMSSERAGIIDVAASIAKGNAPETYCGPYATSIAVEARAANTAPTGIRILYTILTYVSAVGDIPSIPLLLYLDDNAGSIAMLIGA